MTDLQIGDQVWIEYYAGTSEPAKVYTVVTVGTFIARLERDGRMFSANRDVLRKVDES